MKNCSVVVLLLALVGGATAFGQTLNFRAEQLTIPPTSLTAQPVNCIQVGIFMSTENVGMDQDWSQVTVNMDYTDTSSIISGSPVVEVSDFVGTNNPAEVGISSPGTPIAGKSCAPADIINSATLGGMAVNYMPNAADPPSAGGSGFATETVNTVTNHITVGRLIAPGSIFRTNDGEEYLVAIVSFPIDTTMAAINDVIEVNFTSGAGQNIINRTGGALDADGTTMDGFAVLFAPLDCSGATADDNITGNMGANIQIGYLDPMATGMGGDITLTMPHAAQDPDQIRISPNDGSGDIILTGGQIGAGSTTLSLTTGADGTPDATQASVTYQVFYGLTLPAQLGGALGEGQPCNVTVTWQAPSCTIVFDTQPVAGGTTNGDVTLTNAVWDSVNGRFGTVTGPNALAVDLVTPTGIAGNVLTFNDAFTINPIGAANIGTYTVNFNGPASQPGTCSTTLTLACPTNSTSCASIPTNNAIGGSVTIPLSGSNVVDWDITYNGVTTNIPGNSTDFTVMPLVGNQTMVSIVANGFGPGGAPCSDTVDCTIDFAAPTCDSTTQNPDSTVTPVDVGTVITLTLVTTGAVSATIDGTPMTATVGTPGVDNTITWEATHVAVADQTVTAVITNPNGDTVNCTWTIDINCETPQIVFIAPFGQQGITISGTPGCTYTVTVSQNGVLIDNFDILVGDNGEGSDPAFVVPADVCIAVGQLGQLIVTPGCDGGIRTVPTMGEWALIAFAFLLMATGVYIIRRKRLA